jgi:hypothetical protein
MSNNQMKIISVNKTVVFYSPLEGDDVLVRTGTIEDGSLFHSLLHAYSKDYTTMNRRDRIKFVRRLKASLFGNTDKENWINTFVTLEPLNKNVITILTNFYNYLETSSVIKGRSTRRVIKLLITKSNSNLDVYKILKDLIPLEGPLKNHILPIATSKTTPQDYIKTLIRETEKYINATQILDSLDKAKANFVKDTLVKFLAVVTKEAENSAFKDYYTGMKNTGLEADNFTMEFISERLDRDICILSGDTRLPLNNPGGPPKGRKTIIILKVDNTHYEIVGKLLPGNRIQREFESNDIIIEKIYALINNNQSAGNIYPDLARYITQSPTRRSKSNSEDGDSVKDSDGDNSDPYYDDSDSNTSDGSISD